MNKEKSLDTLEDQIRRAYDVLDNAMSEGKHRIAGAIMKRIEKLEAQRNERYEAARDLFDDLQYPPFEEYDRVYFKGTISELDKIAGDIPTNDLRLQSHVHLIHLGIGGGEYVIHSDGSHGEHYHEPGETLSLMCLVVPGEDGVNYFTV